MGSSRIVYMQLVKCERNAAAEINTCSTVYLSQCWSVILSVSRHTLKTSSVSKHLSVSQRHPDSGHSTSARFVVW